MPSTASALQAKLSVGDPSDHFEREADRVADAVMRQPAPIIAGRPEETDGPMIQTKCQACQDGEAIRRAPIGTVQRKCAACGAVEEVQRASAPAPSVRPDFETSVNAVNGGRAMTSGERSFFEPRFSADFSGVRIHEGPQADAAARAVGAVAYTKGRDVVFREGAYSGGASGRHLLAHELTHVIQQGAAAVSPAQVQSKQVCEEGGCREEG